MLRLNGQFILTGFLVALLAALVFTPGLPGAFVFDDVPSIVDNPSIRVEQMDAGTLQQVALSPQPAGNMRLLPTLSFALDHWRAGGMNPAVFKTTNIVLHAVTTLALVWFFRSLLLIAGVSGGRVQWGAPALALAWAVHPLQVSSVLYVVQRMQTMGTLFLVLALLAYLSARQSQIQGRPGRTAMLGAALLWALAMGCKEDSVLLPAYTLALELTVLRFAAADARVANRLRRGYLIATLAGAAAYVLFFLPRYWQWEADLVRDFSTPERLLTQARVLCMYLWQILVPLPQHMPFYYDWLQPSRGLLQPWTTLPAIAFLLALLGTAWRLRTRCPLFALGVFLFFAAHFIASNVVGLELAFEHRNHFALIGAVLAIGSVLAHVAGRLRAPPAVQASLLVFILAGLASATLMRSRDWNGTLALARATTEAAPTSGRAWSSLCDGHYQAGGGGVLANPFLDEAILACQTGAASAPYALSNPAMLVVLKTLRGDVSPEDWAQYQQRLDTVHMSRDNRRTPLYLGQQASEGVKLDSEQLLTAFATLAKRDSLDPFDSAAIGYFVMNDLAEPDQAMPYFTVALNAAKPMDPFPHQLADELRAKHRPDLAKKVEQVWEARFIRTP